MEVSTKTHAATPVHATRDALSPGGMATAVISRPVPGQHSTSPLAVVRSVAPPPHAIDVMLGSISSFSGSAVDLRAPGGPRMSTRANWTNCAAATHMTLGAAFEAWKIYEEIVPKAQRIFGDEHPTTINFKAGLQNVAVGTTNFINDAERTRLAARKIILRFLRRCGGGAP